MRAVIDLDRATDTALATLELYEQDISLTHDLLNASYSCLQVGLASGGKLEAGPKSRQCTNGIK